MKRDRKQYVMKPKWFLLMGPDTYHETKVGPLEWKMLRWFLEWKTPEDAYRDLSKRIYEDESPADADTVLLDFLSEAIHEWNCSWAEEDGSSHVPGWRWLGVAMSGECGEVDVYATGSEGMHNEQTCSVTIKGGALEGNARKVALEAYEVLSGLVKTEIEGDDREES
jgi:hypothetical protein